MTENHPINVVIADDHCILRDGIHDEIGRQPDMRVVGEAANGMTALQLVKQMNPDILLLDINMPDLNGIGVLRELAKYDLKTRTLILSAYSNQEYVYHAFAAGAKGYLLKDEHPKVIIEGIRGVKNNRPMLSHAIQKVVIVSHQKHPAMLTEREEQILYFIAKGSSDKAISRHLSITVNTVKNHIANIYAKLPDVRNRAEAVAWAWQNDVIRAMLEEG